MSRVSVAFPGTCGELFQGTVDGIRCLVSCPLNRVSRLEISATPDAGLSVPASMSKTRRALEIALSKSPLSGGLAVRRLESLPEGKGYASSTADILAALYGFARLSGVDLSPEEATLTALAVEPTDSIAWPGLALLDHRKGRIMEFLGVPPPMAVLVVDEGGRVDTEEFNRRDFDHVLAGQAEVHRESLALLREGLQSGDRAAVGEAASLSSAACDAILPRPLLERCRSLSFSLGGYGVCTAHSGTLYGILLPQDFLNDARSLTEAARRTLPEAVEISLHELTPGGPRF